MIIKAGHEWHVFIVMILFWFHFSGLLNRFIRKKYLVTGDWRQSKVPPVNGHKGNYWGRRKVGGLKPVYSRKISPMYEHKKIQG